MTTAPYTLTWKPTKSPTIWTLRKGEYVAVLCCLVNGDTSTVVFHRGTVRRCGLSRHSHDFLNGEQWLDLVIREDTTTPARRPALLTFVPYGRRKYVEIYLRRKGYADVRLPRRQGDVFVLGEAGSPVVDKVVAHLALIAPGAVVV